MSGPLIIVDSLEYLIDNICLVWLTTRWGLQNDITTNYSEYQCICNDIDYDRSISDKSQRNTIFFDTYHDRLLLYYACNKNKNVPICVYWKIKFILYHIHSIN